MTGTYTRWDIEDYLTCNQLGVYRRQGQVEGIQLPRTTRWWIERHWPEYYLTPDKGHRDALGNILRSYETFAETDGFNPGLAPETNYYDEWLLERNLTAAVLESHRQAEPISRTVALTPINGAGWAMPNGYQATPGLFDNANNKLHQVRIVSRWDDAARDGLLRDPSLCLDSLVMELRLGKPLDYLSVQPIVVGSRKEDHYDCALLRYWRSRIHGGYSLSGSIDGKRLGKDWDKVVLTDLEQVLQWAPQLVSGHQFEAANRDAELFPLPVLFDRSYFEQHSERAKEMLGTLFTTTLRNHRACSFPYSCPMQDRCWG